MEKGLSIFPALLGLGIVTEVCVHFLLAKNGLPYIIIYHVYIPLEYTLWMLYFRAVTQNKLIRTLQVYSIYLFVLLCLVLSIIYIPVDKFPNLQLNLEGILLIIWATSSIFTIEYYPNVNIFSRPVFWICVGVLIYYTGSFSFMGVYNYITANKAALGKVLKIYLLIIPNCILYTSLSIAFLCSQRIKKSL
jgi:hypothetical protein